MNKSERIAAERRKTDKLLNSLGYKKNKKAPKLNTNFPEFLVTGSSRTYYDRRDVTEVCVGDINTGNKRGIMANIQNEPEHVQAEILKKASQVSIGYNKGGYMYITPGIDPKTLGRK